MDTSVISMSNVSFEVMSRQGPVTSYICELSPRSLMFRFVYVMLDLNRSHIVTIVWLRRVVSPIA